MTSTSKFSVVTPSYCQGKFIQRTIDSVLSQKSPSIEIEYIICDGGSTDNTLDIIQSYDKSLKWISEPDKGQADAVNKGIAKTTGDIIAWINSDDVYYPGAFKAVKAIFDKNPEVKVIYGDADHIDENDNFINAYPTEAWNYQRLIEICYLCQPAVFFKRDLVKKFGALDISLNYCMDYELWLRYGSHTDFYYLSHKLAGSRLYQDNKTLGQRVAVHYEINKMFFNKFRYVPDKWLFAYAHVKVEDIAQWERSCPLENKKFVDLLVKNSLLSFWHWRQWISLKSLTKIIFWWIHANFIWIKKMFS